MAIQSATKNNNGKHMLQQLAHNHVAIISANQNYKNIIKINIPQTPSKIGVLQSKTFSHTPDEAMFDGLAKACDP